ncbi:Tex family protein [Shewanella xiamenensis]|uniref:Tex family protein n=1 Tax=Shewanella xiamenensis TaxID=332186 RepID=UPI00166B0E09|nr:Tex family protein [Shewanella xiamenensis]MBW0296276.1 RNA-binding transcriptional accessory protein [Shewanella xiamenensis]MCL1071007.1 RNA-binding transcriptional accessory protein [Shewanella xiamenensis]MCR4533309.1 RNA-binding transcriptional accessory protein [Shewanella xiamenensis]MDI5874631.1 RNA-binding transcriptional accessory protein [Shewanella xiamenensis]WHF55574.1 RNA-binding transcriptional accessory protein [Shewanella xiamenensis]
MQTIAQIIAQELNVREHQVTATIDLLDNGATVPFVARYRKEATGGLDDTQLRTLYSRLGYLRELNDRRQVILSSIQAQGKLTPELQREIEGADSKTRLEDLYLPFKPKRRTKGQIAIEAGLEPLVETLLADRNADIEALAAGYLNLEAGFADTKAVLEGARYILMERYAEDAELLRKVREHLSQNSVLESRVIAGKEKEGAKFRDYFEHNEPLAKVPSHRALAMLRGRNEGFLSLSMNADPGAEAGQGSYCEVIISEHLGLKLGDSSVDQWLKTVVTATWRIKIALQMETEFISQMRERAEAEAINVFARNLGDLLMAAPAGAKATMGLDPGLRTGVKVAVVDNTGKLVAHTTIFPHAPQNLWDKSIRTLANLVQMHKVELIAIGNGTASRETDKLAAELIASLKDSQPQLTKVMVSEAGASVYSASELAALEFPELDVSIRGAVSIARRLQDPLAELVKIEPKSIGVGQYQHDVSQSQLSSSLEAVVEDCVNGVGVDLNMASVPLLSQVAGLNKTLAKNVVDYRDANGAFKNRKELLKVPRLGPKAFEQAAGFLRIRDGDNPLDMSAVHPEAYSLVETIAKTKQVDVASLIGNSELLRNIKPQEFTTPEFGLPTVTDILSELDKPGRDPRGEFKTAKFKDGVEELKDLKPEMILEGVVTNVTNFGAFVDIGVHQDGLVHISSLTDKFITDPHTVVKAGDVVKVKVMEVDVERRRIGLSMRLDEAIDQSKSQTRTPVQGKHQGNKPNQHKASQHKSSQPQSGRSAPKPAPVNAAMGNAFADAFAKLKK